MKWTLLVNFYKLVCFIQSFKQQFSEDKVEFVLKTIFFSLYNLYKDKKIKTNSVQNKHTTIFN